MKNIKAVIGVILSVSLLAGCGSAAVEKPSKDVTAMEETKGFVQAPKPEKGAETPAEVKLGELENVFGIADESGKRLITLPGEAPVEHPEEFDIAVGNNGEIAELAFAKQQAANDKDNGRQTMYNFDNMAGNIYEVKNGELVQNQTYLLTKKATMDKNTLIGLQDTQDRSSQMPAYKKVDGATIQKVEAVKERKIVQSSLLAETAEGAKICLFVFERRAEDMLASIAYIKEDEIVFKDYPAVYNESGTWRVDAGDDPGWMEVMFLAQSDEGLLLGMSWGAPEGEVTFILKAVNGVFEETGLGSGRYWSPM